MPQSDVYSPAQRALHWLMAALILCMVPVGVYMTDLPWEPPPGADPLLKGRIYEMHKSFGIVVFLLACARVFVRVVKGAPPAEASLTPFQRRASAAVHHLLYALIFIVPISGWIATSMCCAPVNLFWSVPVTLPISGTPESSKPVFAVHFTAAFLMTALILGHIGAALMHALILKDGVLRRMWPGRG